MSDGKPHMKCTNAQFHALWDAEHKTRKKATTVKVDRAALTAVLMDHSELLNHFSRDITVDEF